MYHILTADEDQKTRELITLYGEHAGFAVTGVRSGTEVLQLCDGEGFDLLLMETMLPQLDGYSVLLSLRQNPKTALLPVIFLSERASEQDRIHGFEAGCDDYVAKPFSPRELILRIEAVLRRTNGSAFGTDVFRYRALSVDFTAQVAELAGERLRLTPKEFALLSYLVKNRNTVLTRDELLGEVWGYDYYGDARTLDTHIKKLRRQLGEYGRLITTVHGVGYRLDA